RKAGLKKRPVEYYRMIYADTALNGSASATRCGHDFFGTEHCLFATDAPFDSEHGRMLIRETIKAVDALEIPRAEKQKILSGNAASLPKLHGCAPGSSGSGRATARGARTSPSPSAHPPARSSPSWRSGA